MSARWAWVLCLVAGVALAAPKPKVVVLSVSATEPGLQALAQSITEQVLTELGEGQRVDVVGSSDLAAMLGLERQKQLLGCGETSCFAELSAAMGAPWLVVGTLGRAGKVLRLDLKLIRASDGQAAWRSGKIIKDEAEVFDVVTTLARQLLAVLLDAAKSPALVVTAPGPDDVTPPLEVVQPAKPSPRVAPWVLAGSGVVLAGVGAGLAIGAATGPDVRRTDWTGLTTQEVRDREAATNAMFVGGLVGAGLGVAALGVGLAWGLQTPATRVTVVPAGNAVLVVGSF